MKARFVPRRTLSSNTGEGDHQTINSDIQIETGTFFRKPESNNSNTFDFDEIINTSPQRAEVIDPSETPSNHLVIHAYQQSVPVIVAVGQVQSQPVPKGKGRNILQFVVRLLKQHITVVEKVLREQNSRCFQEVHQYLIDLFQWVKQSPGHNYINQSHLKWLIEQRSSKPKTIIRSRYVRMAIAKILRMKMGDVTLRNKKCQHEKLYLNTLKVYQLRSMCPSLALRLQC